MLMSLRRKQLNFHTVVKSEAELHQTYQTQMYTPATPLTLLELQRDVLFFRKSVLIARNLSKLITDLLFY